MKYYVYLLLICSQVLFLSGCNNGKEKREYDALLNEIKAEEKKQREIYNYINKELSDDFCKKIIENSINEETKQKLNLSGGAIRIKKFSSGEVTYIVGESIFEGKVKNSNGFFAYTIELENSNREKLKDPSSWELSKLIIRKADDTKRFFIAGKGVMEVGDQIIIDGIKITLTRDTGRAQKFTTSSRLSKEQIMKLKDCRERKPVGIISLFLKGAELEYAQYQDGVKGLFMYSPDRIYEVKKEGNTYKFEQIKY